MPDPIRPDLSDVVLPVMTTGPGDYDVASLSITAEGATFTVHNLVFVIRFALPPKIELDLTGERRFTLEAFVGDGSRVGLLRESTDG